MPLSVSFKVDKSLFDTVTQELAGISNGVNRAISGGINKSLTTLRSRTATRLGKILNMKKGSASNPGSDTISSFLGIRKAFNGGKGGAASLEGWLKITGRQIPLFLFHPVPSAPGPSTLPGVSVKTRHGKAMEMIRHAFIARMKNGHLAVVKRAPGTMTHRVTKDRNGKKYTSVLPIRQLFGPTALGVFETAPGVAEEVTREAGDLLTKNVMSQVDYLLGRKKSDRPAGLGGGE